MKAFNKKTISASPGAPNLWNISQNHKITFLRCEIINRTFKNLTETKLGTKQISELVKTSDLLSSNILTGLLSKEQCLT